MLRRFLLTLLLALPLLSGTPPASVAAASVPSVTDSRYFTGVNVPWFNWGCDFGCNGNGGVSSQNVNSSLATSFASLQAAGVHTVRWWVFEGDATQITRDASGPTGLNPSVYPDFDAALGLASKYDLAFDFVLFSAPTAVPQGWINDAGQRQKLANALAPLFDRYKDNPHILAWEIFNEPEWDILNNKIQQQPVQDTVKLLASTIHQHTSNSVTVGSASLEGVSLWRGLGLDFYSPHWYDPMDSGLACARCTDVPTLQSKNRVDLPVVICKFFGSANTDTLQRFKDFRTKGYAGAWAWSLLSDHTSDKMAVDMNAVSAFTATLTQSAPAGPQPTPAPSATPTPDVRLSANWVTPTYATPGQSVTINQVVRTGHDASVLVDFEVDDENGQQVWQQALDNQGISASADNPFSATFSVPDSLPSGQYTVKTGLFSPGGETRYAWSDQVGTFIVAPAPPADDADFGS